jgi:2,3-bisphosphoglycerate-independent phosphoglycerate mutase
MKKVILIIMDGVGVRKAHLGNAVVAAKKPNLDYLMKTYPHTTLLASQEAVGLPKGQMGNSEVGHLNIGAGRVVYTGLSLINQAVKDASFVKNFAFLKAFKNVKDNHTKLHILGLTSNGGVHASLNHIIALIKLAYQHQIPTVLHCFGDGRDVKPKTLLKDLVKLLPILKRYQVKLGSISGRYYAMDRDQRWSRVMKAYQTLLGEAKLSFTNPSAYIQQAYKQNITDEFLLPALNANYPKNEICLADNDSVIFANFRPDRARELTHLIYGSTYYDFQPPRRCQQIYFVTMMQYEGIKPSAIAFAPMDIKDPFGAVIASHHLRQLRIAETEKYAHVTFFFDGGKEIKYPHETKIIVPSPKVATYDLCPQMSAQIITDKLLKQLPHNDVVIVNFANGDMVGHTGNYQATIKAIEVIDYQIGRIYDVANKLGFTLFITADHGNADEEFDAHHKKITAHTLSPVLFLVTNKYVELKKGGKLCNIAPTILDFMTIPKPQVMLATSLLLKLKH